MVLSIVTISFNQSAFIERCIQSVINQSNVNFEYIVVDAGSTDGSREIILKYKSSISKIIFEPDNGPPDGLNKGFKYASGDILGFLNADDTYISGAFKKVHEYFNKNKEVDVVCGNGYRIDQFDKRTKNIYTDVFSLKKYALGVYNFIQPSVFFRKKAFESIGGFNSNNRTCWDAELLVDLALNGCTIKRYKEFLSNFRIHDQSISGTGKVIEAYNVDRERLRQMIQQNIKYKDFTFQRCLYRGLNLLQTPQKLFA